MGQGYTRNDTSNNIADGNVINASDLDGEFNAVDAAFNESSGHTHDGTADEGAPVTVLGPVQDFVASATEIKPKTSNTLDIGTASLQFKDMYLDGTAYIDGLGEDILVATDKKVQFRDTALFINSSTDGQLDIAADTEVEITTALVEISADATVGDDLTLKSDAAVLGFGADTDVTLTHVADTGLLLNAAMVVQFRDSAINIGSPADGDLDINADDEIELNSTLIDINGNLDVSGTIVGASTLSATTGTFSGILKTDDATEATSTTDGSLQTDGGLSVVKDAVFGDDIKLLSDSAVIHFGADSDITLTHAADTSLATNGVMIATTFEPTGDTAAGDNAAIGYTAAEGLILTGQGSTSDITLKNDADATVFTVPTGTDDILFPDNAKAMFGAGSDLQIYHDGSNSYIVDTGTGGLFQKANAEWAVQSQGTDEYFIQAASNSFVKLFFNGSEKLATTNTGVDVTGTLVSDGLTVSGDAVFEPDNDGVRITGTNYATLRLEENDTTDLNTTMFNSAGKFSISTSSDNRASATERVTLNHSTGNLNLLSDSVGIGAANDQAVVAAAEPLVVTADGSSVGTNEVAHFAYPQTSGNLFGMRLRQVVTSGVVNHTFATYNNGTEYASNLVLEGGQVAIGTSSPAFQLDVRGNVASNYLAYFFNDGNNANRYGVLIQAGADSGGGTLVGFNDGDGTGVGGITFSGGTVTYGAFTAQHPCIIPDADNDPDSDLPAYPYGTLLETTSLSYIPKSDGTDSERGIRYNVRKTQTANSKAVLGAYGCSMNGGPENQTNEHQALVLGDGHILCNNSGGNIEMGDGICSSAAAGIGQKATANPSMIIGIAQEAVTFSSDTETKLVAVQYGLQQFIPWS